MQWSDTGIILSANKYGESSLILRIFTPSRGVHAGLVRASKKTRNIYQVGNIVDVSWKARLEEHLGNFSCELKTSIAGFILNDADKLMGLQSACAMIEQTMAERDPHPELYNVLEVFLLILKTSLPLAGGIEGGKAQTGTIDNTINHHHSPSLTLPRKREGELSWQTHYIQLELELLTQLGFGLDLRSCAATGVTENLKYVSPKSGRAVSEEAGLPYADRLLLYPNLDENSGVQDIKDGLRLTAYFLNNHFFTEHNKKLPAVRERLEAKIYS
jgi:DNA repair protein RecO (recombination protein O)